MSIEAVQSLALPVGDLVIDNDGSAQKIVDDIDQPAPVQRHHNGAFRKLMFAVGLIKSKTQLDIAQKMRRLNRSNRLVFDYLRMTENSCAGACRN